jgi:hypothetical protein
VAASIFLKLTRAPLDRQVVGRQVSLEKVKEFIAKISRVAIRQQEELSTYLPTGSSLGREIGGSSGSPFYREINSR